VQEVPKLLPYSKDTWAASRQLTEEFQVIKTGCDQRNTVALPDLEQYRVLVAS
jgi:hypothetical protein